MLYDMLSRRDYNLCMRYVYEELIISDIVVCIIILEISDIVVCIIILKE